MINIQESRSTLKEYLGTLMSKSAVDRLMEGIDENKRTYELDTDKYCDAILDSIRGKDISAPETYIRKVAWSIANTRHEELKREYLPNFLELHLLMDKIGMVGPEWEKYLIDEVETHCINEFPVTTQEVLDTNIAILEYCKEKKFLTYRQFLACFLSSKIGKKCNIPLKMLEEKVKAELDDFNEMIRKLEEKKRRTFCNENMAKLPNYNKGDNNG